MLNLTLRRAIRRDRRNDERREMRRLSEATMMPVIADLVENAPVWPGLEEMKTRLEAYKPPPDPSGAEQAQGL